jgi:DNA mismatch endonuclease (patch repair protein)
MRANRRRDTSPEITIRSALHALGFRYRVDRPIRVDGRIVRPDLVFVGPRVVVFIDGCFWHGCPQHGELPRANREFWRLKLRANRRRDASQTRILRAHGWSVLRVWEHEPAESATRRIAKRVRDVSRAPSQRGVATK